MATVFNTGIPAEGTEERFFFKMACAIALVLVAGFSVQLAMGRSSFAVPLVYHLHAFVFFGWVVLFVMQSGLIAANNVVLHRRLGKLSAIWIPAMVVLGITITVESMRRTGGPFFFGASEFLIGNPTGLLAFAAMISAAVALRKQSDWHRRLMLCAMAAITGPGFGRLLPMPLMIPYAWEISNTVGSLFILAGMIRDKRHNGMVHPAWFVGLAVMVGWIALGELIAQTDWAMALTRQVMEGHPGAARPMEPYLP